jgi:DNA invertase Pin-like site-specific DNA recombinase
MNRDRPELIKHRHLERKAVVYIRQSTGRQVVENEGSTVYQRAQAEHARRWGFLLVEINDEDLGVSGRSIEMRPGYQRMFAEISRGEVGMLLFSALTRAGRDAVALLLLTKVCAATDTLISEDGRVYDMRDPGSRFVKKIEAIVAEHENDMRTADLRKGRIAKAQQGKVVGPVPAGYKRRGDGTVDLDPDENVQAALREIFEVTLEKRGLKRALKEFLRRGRMIPKQRPGHNVHWVKPTLWNLPSVVHNEFYAGTYRYPREVIDPSLGLTKSHRPRARPAKPDEQIVFRNHHHPYVSPGDFEEIQGILAENHRKSPRGPLGGSKTLLQGLLRCEAHYHRKYFVHFGNDRRDGSRSHRYRCHGDSFTGGSLCRHIPGAQFDELVEEAVISHLSPASLEWLCPELDFAEERARSRRRRDEMLLAEARRQVEDLQYRYLKVDADNRLVALRLENELQKALENVQTLERASREAAANSEVAFDERLLAEARTLYGDVRRILYAPTTEKREVKELFHMVIDKILVIERSLEQIRASICWKDGSPPTEIELKLVRYIHSEIEQLAAAGWSNATTAQYLKEQGMKTEKNRQWSANSVGCHLRQHQRRLTYSRTMIDGTESINTEWMQSCRKCGQ